MTRFVVGLLMAGVAFAQTASVTGKVTDPSGAPAPGVRVAAQAAESGVVTETLTNQDGYYSLGSLLPGTYNLTISKTGFEQIKEDRLTLEVQQVARMDFKLKVGEVSQSIEVTALTPLLESENTAVGQVVDGSQVTELPLLGRNPYALAILVPGVRASSSVNTLPIDIITTVYYAVGGQRASANGFLLDGAPNSAPSGNTPVINATPDMVQEFKVETNNFSAEYARAGGGVFNVITKSGSNQYHGALYEFFRNDKLNANDYFANRAGAPRPPFKYNQFGGTLGGPVTIPKVYNGHNRTFFFISEEFVRFIQGVVFVGTLPTPSQLAGNFTNTKTTSGQLITIYDPATTVPNGSGYIRTPFPGNIIPASRINPVSENIVKYFPTVNQPNSSTGVNDYTRSDGSHVRKNTASYRVDHYFSERNRVFVRYSADDTPFIRAGVYGSDDPASPSAGTQAFGRRNSVVEDTQTFSPTWLGTFRYSFTRLSNDRTPYGKDFDMSTLGLPASLTKQFYPPSFPYISIAGESVTSSVTNIITGGLLGATDIIINGNNTSAAQFNTSKVSGSHEIKAGADFWVIQENILQTGANSPSFTFAANWTQGPNPTVSSATAGSAIATFLLGVMGGSYAVVPALATQTKLYGLFVQDRYKVTSRLTLNYGLRWDYETPRTDRFNQLGNFNYSEAPPLNTPGLNLHGVLTFVGVNGQSRYQANPDYNNFAPRFGLAYQLDKKTVIRTGGGIFYSNNWGVAANSSSFGSDGFLATSTIVTSVNGVNPTTFLDNPFPSGLARATGSSLGPATLLGQAVDFYDRSNPTPYSAQWNFNIQHQFRGNVLLEVGYMGSRGLKFPFTTQLNQLPTADLALGNALTNQFPNPFYGQISTGVDATATVSRAQLLRPYPQFGAVASDLDDIANSTYHAMTVRFQRRYSKGLTVLVSYTYSKIIDIGIGAFGGETVSAGGIQNYDYLKGEYSPSAIDRTHQLVSNAVYQLPFFKTGHRFLSKPFGGWELGVIVSFGSGGPLGITQNTNNTSSQGGGQRPNWTGISARISNPTVNDWFDTTQFTTAPSYAFGNLARTLGGLRSDGLHNADMTLNKFFPIGDRVKLQFRAEFFNLSNTPQFQPPNTTQGATAFGTISGVNNQPRVIQFALKLLY
jgi:hypothetical protein